MTGNILGEPFDPYVRNQIEARQKIYGGGYDPLNPRTPETLNYLNNRNAWVKLASSVFIQTGPNTGSIDPPGEQKLKDIGFSMAEINAYGGTNLAKKAVLFNGLSQFNEGAESNDELYTFRSGVSRDTSLWNDISAYGLGGNNYGIQPMPGITDVSVECVNRGSIRKAVVNIIAHNKFQFELIELLYIRLGFTMMLEWGWDKYIDYNTGNITDVGNTIIEDSSTTGGWFTSTGISQLDMLKKIEFYRDQYQGNYDGFFGKVSNFNWKFNPDGTYNITLNLITIGDVIESIKIKNKVLPLNSNIIDATSQQSNLSRDSIIVSNANNDILSQYLFLTIKENNVFNTQFSNSDYIRIGTGALGSTAENPNTSYRYYMTLGELLRKVQTDVIPVIKNGSSLKSQLEIDLDNTLNICTSYFNLLSIDPRVCVIRPDILDNTTTGQKVNEDNVFKKFKPFTTYVGLNEDASEEDFKFPYGKLMNIYLNYDFISKALDSNSTSKDINLYEFLKAICDGINRALGDTTNLEPVIKDDLKIVIIDQNILPEKVYKNIGGGVYNLFNDTTPVDLEIYGYNSTATSGSSTFVKDVSFNTKITPQLAAEISIGATADGIGTQNIEASAFSKWNTGLVDRFSEKITQALPAVPTVVTGSSIPSDNELEEIYKSKKQSRTIGFYGGSTTTYWSFYTFNGEEKRIDPAFTFAQYKEGVLALYNSPQEQQAAEDAKFSETWLGYIERAFLRSKGANYWKYNSDFINEGREILLSTIKINKKEAQEANPNNTSNTVGFIPIDFGLTMDGLSGIKIYQQLKIRQEFLPRQYPRTFKFLITRVNHKISDNNWDTQLQTISTSNIENIDKNYMTTIGQNDSPPTPVVEDLPTEETNTSTITPTPDPEINLTEETDNNDPLKPLKDLIAYGESRGKYNIANIGSERYSLSSTDITSKTIQKLFEYSRLNKGNPQRVFAMGKYQIIPDTLRSVLSRSNIVTESNIFDKETQEKIGDWLILDYRSNLYRYIKGINNGTKEELADAIQSVGQIWASMPCYRLSSGTVVADLDTLSGDSAYYGGVGTNPSKSKVTISQMVKALIQSRIQYSNKQPSFKPV